MTTATDGVFLHLEQARRQTSQETDSDHKAEWGQFLTPAPLARMMASLLECRKSEISILDAGAGAGALFAAAVTMFCRRPEPPQRIHVTAYEMDTRLLDCLMQTLAFCQAECAQHSVEFTSEIRTRDFIEDAANELSGGLFGHSVSQRFDCAILNPPYRKIRANSPHRKWLRRIGVETGNLYTGFLAAAIEMLTPQGEIVAITPRSFCNGPYFKAFRKRLLSTMSLTRLHLFDSRQEAFQDDNVLQENIIFRAVKNTSNPNPGSVFISHSTSPSAQSSGQNVSYDQVVQADDSEFFIRITVGEKDEQATQILTHFSHSLDEIGVEVSTGRVVEFRAREWLLNDWHEQAAPLVYPVHLCDGQICWPKASKKANALSLAKETQSLLIPNETYVLVKRFSSKEQRKRISATVYAGKTMPGSCVGFENHLNYFHAHGHGLDTHLARGLAAYLNSTLIDVFFRQFSGHTQVNATDLRSLKYPSAVQLRTLGTKISHTLTQKHLDALIEAEFFRGSM